LFRIKITSWESNYGVAYFICKLVSLFIHTNGPLFALKDKIGLEVKKGWQRARKLSVPFHTHVTHEQFRSHTEL
jgi:hypothetical protein